MGALQSPRQYNMKRSLLFALLLGTEILPPLALAIDPPQPPIRIVSCDADVKSTKRGVCANKLDAADFKALSPSLSWYYSWFYEETVTPPPDAKIEFLPMVWGDDEKRITGLKNYLAKGNRPRAVLAINEPNLKGQAFITPEKTAALYTKIKAIADQYKLPTVGPHMAIGSPTGSAIKAMDPIEHKEVTYGFMVPFLKAFFHYTDASKTEVGGIGVHGYGAIGELKWVVEMTYKEFHRPVWVTEYAWWKAPDMDDARKFLIESTDFLENNPHVAGYAWFKERANDNPKISLLEQTPGELSPLGKAYVAMPVHEANVFYKIPGRLSAGRYVTASDMTLKPTKDAGGFLHLEAGGDGATADYNLAVNAARSYPVKIRTLGHAGGKIEFLSGTTTLGTATLDKDGWQEVETKLTLPAGNQTIRIKTSLLAVNWIEFL
jgi:hypothetical protein